MAMIAGAVVSAQDDTMKNGGRGGLRGFGGQSEVILDATGLTSEELHTALQDGSTIADLITANDGDVDSVIAELITEATTHINEHVAAGRITQAQADEMLANLEANITARLDGTFERPDGFGGRGGFGFYGQNEIILDATGLTPEELRSALQDGTTIADLITANGGDVDSVIAELSADDVARLTERLNGTFEHPEGFGGRGGRGRHGMDFGDNTGTDDSPVDTSDDT